MQSGLSRSLAAYLKRSGATSGPAARAALGLAVALACLAALLGLAELAGGDALRRAWALSKGPVLAGEVWRLVTAHLVHLSPMHTFLNILGLGLVGATMWAILTPARLGLAVLVSGAAISAGWMLLEPAGPSYVGFSGITHGLYAFGSLLMLRAGPRWLGAVLLAGLTVKLGHEAVLGAVPGAEAEIGGKVSLLSHALGSLGGALAAAGAPGVPRVIVVLVAAALATWHAAPWAG